jgi:hypothetical protein
MSNSVFVPTVQQSFKVANELEPGMVSTDDQSFSGTKTFTRIGVGTDTPSVDLGFGGEQGRAIRVERNATPSAAGQTLTVQAGGAAVGTTNGNGGDLILQAGSSTGSGSSNIQFRTSSAGSAGVADNTQSTKMVIQGNGDVITSANITAYGNLSAYSDRRLKSNIKTLDSALDKVLKLRGVSYVKDGKSQVGVIAQEVNQVVPEVVLGTESEDSYLSVSYGNLVGLLIEAIKEQQKTIESLRAEINGGK